MKMAEYIEKNKIINLLEHNDKVYHYADRDKENIVHDTVQTLCRVIIDAEAADVQPVKHGRWIISNIYAHCSECSVAYDLDTFQRLIPMHENVPRHCSYCGARMDE